MSQSRDMTLHIIYGDLRVTLVAESVSWSPDVAADMVTRGVAAFREAFDIAGDFATEADDLEEAPTDED